MKGAKRVEIPTLRTEGLKTNRAFCHPRPPALRADAQTLFIQKSAAYTAEQNGLSERMGGYLNEIPVE
jgi:hypothetical protein